MYIEDGHRSLYIYICVYTTIHMCIFTYVHKEKITTGLRTSTRAPLGLSPIYMYIYIYIHIYLYRVYNICIYISIQRMAIVVYMYI